MNIKPIVLGSALLGLLLCSGCGSSTGTLPISGNVTYQNKAVAGAKILFMPKSGGRPADGITNSDGFYQLGTFQSGDGALPGEYAVTISSIGTDLTEPPSTEITDPSAYDVPESDPAKASIPAKYLFPDKSGLKAVIEVGGPKEFNFTLTD